MPPPGHPAHPGSYESWALATGHLTTHRPPGSAPPGPPRPPGPPASPEEIAAREAEQEAIRAEADKRSADLAAKREATRAAAAAGLSGVVTGREFAAAFDRWPQALRWVLGAHAIGPRPRTVSGRHFDRCFRCDLNSYEWVNGDSRFLIPTESIFLGSRGHIVWASASAGRDGAPGRRWREKAQFGPDDRIHEGLAGQLRADLALKIEPELRGQTGRR